MKKIVILAILLALITACNRGVPAEFSVTPIVSNGAVLQRGKPNQIWGGGTAGNWVTVQFDNKIFCAKVNQNGCWSVETDTLQSGGPFTLTAICGKDTLTFIDIWVGDVWLCSGQSNMEFSVGNFPWKDAEIGVANNEQIRFYTVPNETDVVPAKTVPASIWRKATGAELGALSATAYFFAKNIQPEIGVPVGLIVSDWSGTSIEPWMSREAIAQFPQFDEVVKELSANTQSKKEINEAFAQYRKDGWDSLYYLAGQGMQEKWHLPETDFSSWNPIKFPNYWEDAEVGLDNFDGAVWFKTTFDLPENFDGSAYQIFLNYVKDYNRAWVNGHELGEVFGNKTWSDYYAPAAWLKPKDNVLVVRVFNVEGKGGFNYHPLWESKILAGNWVCKPDYAIDAAVFPTPKIVNINPFSYPTGIYNAMIAPLQKCAVTGFVWYQGESNEGRAYEYRSLFPAMIKDWRQKFAQGDLPFYFVQLANYENPPAQPVNSDWAELRESQTYALQLPHTGMAVAIDIGEAGNIHPKNKQEVGKRLALLALSDTYKKDVDAKYPTVSSITFAENRVTVQIEPSSLLQKVNANAPIRGFAIAGQDSVFYWAENVLLADNTIIVSSSKVKNPIAVRYAWSKNPGTLNLRNQAGLPLAPFRSDNWKGVTDARVFDLNVIYF
jgi:sialate O-acetylesterase